jgi:hypothetical protein
MTSEAEATEPNGSNNDCNWLSEVLNDKFPTYIFILHLPKPVRHSIPVLLLGQRKSVGDLRAPCSENEAAFRLVDTRRGGGSGILGVNGM